MHLFGNDYCEACSKEILEALVKYSSEQNITYGLDYHSKNAANYIKNIFNAKEADVHFLAGGTLTNVVFISSCLKHYEGVISCSSGHINVHETAATEGAGYKIITVPGENAKVRPIDIKNVLAEYTNEHMVKPRMVYISNSTEYGTIYCEQELRELYKTCKENDLYFFIDGARLGSALTSKYNDVKPSLLGEICDAFYIGGTKNGLLFGEALVINNKELQKEFRYHIKNKGAMLAKGYVLGIQFERAFQDDLYFSLAKHANLMADLLKEELNKLNLPLLDSPTNQIFVSFKRDVAIILMKEFGLEKWEDRGEEIIVRLVTSFLTKKEDIDEFITYVKNL